MAEKDEKIPTLAELRASRPARRSSRRPQPPALPGLFAFAEPLTEPEAQPVSASLSPSVASSRPTAPLPLQQAEEAKPTPAEAPRIYKVGELVRHIRGIVEDGFAGVTVEGEISNWRPASSGHCYFTLKDAQAQLQIVMFRAQAQRLRWRPKDGDAVRLTGAVSVYEARGQMQMVAERMEQLGLGALLEATRQLKERLRQEGLFERERPLPPFPRCIGIVTSLQGAALRDIVKVCRRRHAAVNLLVYPAAVQGPNCSREVAAGVHWFSRHASLVDVVLVARGGGSWEDLHGFDAEEVARAIAVCEVPVITGIGHAPDSTIADAAADLCAPTPSAAAEIVTAAQHRIEERILRLEERLHRAGRYELLRAQQRFGRLSAEMVLRRAEDGLRRRAQRLDELDLRTESALRRRISTEESRVSRLEMRLRQRHPIAVLSADRLRFEAATTRLERFRHTLIDRRSSRLERATLRLEAMSPLRVLDRGYSLVYTNEGTLVRSAAQLHAGQAMMARFSEGSVRARVESSEQSLPSAEQETR
ncbi:MAG: exodeoxyribonuclease VII large subunit [Acidobacteriaceae bacterium]|nr:exodeoxyribonuclease VII large subunit [Acidobacteriaceae bacterium]